MEDHPKEAVSKFWVFRAVLVIISHVQRSLADAMGSSEASLVTKV